MPASNLTARKSVRVPIQTFCGIWIPGQTFSVMRVLKTGLSCIIGFEPTGEAFIKFLVEPSSRSDSG